MATSKSVLSGTLHDALAERAFFQRLAIGVALFILFGFAQFAARGLVDYRTIPIWYHLHGAVMTGWLTLTALQTTLAARGNIALHRKLGWLALLFIAAIPVLGIAALVATLRSGHLPPFFSPGYFLTLNASSFTLFLALIALALLRRANTAWHARAILSANVLLMSPALSRLLPMRLLGANGMWLGLLVQLIPLALLARHDRRASGAIHPATRIGAGVVLADHILVTALGFTPAAALAASIVSH